MAAVAVYKVWLGTQGRIGEAGQIPPRLLTKLDQELPDALGHVILRYTGPLAFETIVLL